MLKLIHLTDTHLAPVGRNVFGLDPSARLSAVVGAINRFHSDADLCVITGDIAHSGDQGAYEALRTCLSSLSVPAHVMLGNHDCRAAYRAVFPRASWDKDGHAQTALATPEGRLLFLDTSEPNTASGSYDAARRDWLGAELQAHAGSRIFLFMHHPPFPLYLERYDRTRLTDAEAFWGVIAPYRQNIAHIFFGHVHQVVAGSWRGIPISAVRGTNHHCSLEHGRYYLGHVIDQGSPSYSVVFIDDDNVSIQYRDLATGEPGDIYNVQETLKRTSMERA